jgi:formylglycine-generating enzyme required for sulfatase activity
MSMMQNKLWGLALVAVSSIALAQAPKPPYDLGKVLKDREAAYAQWSRAHPGAEQGVPALKKQTEKLVKAAGPAALAASRTVASAPLVWRVPGAVTELWDASDLPPLVVVPAGAFTMGLPPNDENKNDTRHPVTIATPFALGKYPVTRAEFAHFVVDTGYQVQGPCSVRNGEKWVLDPLKGWRDPGFAQTADDPVVCVSWNDAMAYTAWLGGKTGRKYRLPSAAEYEHAASAGTTTVFWYGDKGDHEYMNYGSDDLCPGGACQPMAKGRDRWLYTSPVGSFPPNPFGLYDMNGNVRQVVADCGSQYPVGSPVDGSPDTTDCSRRRQRSGSWNSVPTHSYPQGGHVEVPDYRSSSLGFRVARTL